MCRLCLAVLLIAAAAVSAADQPPFITLSTMDSVMVKLAPSTEADLAHGLGYRIAHWPNGAVLQEGVIAPGQIERDGHGLPTFRIGSLRPKLWSLADPQLYTIVIASGDREIGQVRFGFRTFEVRDRKFYLNGRPIFLRAVPINPPGRGLPEDAANDPAFARAYLRLLKSAHVNMVRTDWLDACDEVGLLNFGGRYGTPPGGTSDLPPALEKALPVYRELFWGLASHPSYAIYVLSNEVNHEAYAGYLEQVREDLRLLDPTRLVIGNAGFGRGEGGEIFDIHPYYGWYHGNNTDWYRLARVLREADAAGKPLTLSECVAAYTSDAGPFQTMTKQMPTVLLWTGPVADQRGAALDYQAEVVRQTVEIARRLRTKDSSVAGVMPFTYFLGWAHTLKPQDLIIKPAFEMLKVVFQPVLISPECWKRNLYAGDPLSLRLCVANDDDSAQALAPSRAAVEVVAPNGRVVARGTVAFPMIPYYANAWSSLAIRLPKPLLHGDYKVRCALIEKGRVISRSSFQLTVAPRDWAQSTASAAVYDPSEKTVVTLRRLGVRVMHLASLRSLPQRGVLVIGERAFDTGEYPARVSVLAFLERGGRILCLRQHAKAWQTDWLPANLSMTSRSLTYIHQVGDNTALFNDIRERDLRYWNSLGPSLDDVPQICPVEAPLAPRTLDDLRNARVWAACGSLLSSAAIIELTHGRGSIVLSQFRCVDRTGSDPIAERLLANLVNSVASSTPPSPPDLSRPLRWDLEAFRRGVFVSRLQGLLPTSPTFARTGPSKGLQGEDHRINGFTLVGDYNFNSMGHLRAPALDQEGWGIFFGTLGRRATRMGLLVHNPTKQPLPIRAKLDGKEIGSPVLIQPGKYQTLEWATDRQPGPVEVKLRGSQQLVLKRSWFR